MRDVSRTLAVTLCLLSATLFAMVCQATATLSPAPCVHQVSGMQKSGPWSFEFRNEPLDRALFVISEHTGTDFIYEPGITAGIYVTAVFRKKELGDILEELLLPFGLEARRIRTGIFVIRHSLRRELVPHLLPALQGDPLPDLLSLQSVPSAAAEHGLPLRKIILQIVAP